MICLAAVSNNWVIGDSKTNKIPWHSKEDFAFFREKTLNNNIIVGRKTFLSLPKLKDRYIFILSNILFDNLIDKDNILVGIKNHNNEAYIISNEGLELLGDKYILCGGREVYLSCLNKCTELFLTKFNFEINIENPVYFPFTEPLLNLMFKNVEEVRKIKDGAIFRYYN